MPPTESTLDCSTYKSERKEFHETKLKRLPAPYDVLGQSCATVCQGAGITILHAGLWGSKYGYTVCGHDDIESVDTPASIYPAAQPLFNRLQHLTWVGEPQHELRPCTIYEDERGYANNFWPNVVSVIRRQPVLDKTAESNALPFVLQGYARWINRLALDPLKMTDIARDFVFGQFQDGDQSRWVIALLANIGSRIGSVDLAEGKHNHMLSVLQTAAVCGDPSNSPRVKDAFKRYMKLLNGIKPGRLPDEFLILTLKLIAAAAEQPRDREVIEQRALRLYTRDRTHLATTFIISVISDVWARADAERRPVLWSDIAVSRRQVLGV
ncbi:unnamed protein product [Rhizoctonia solani]|uniref:Uncharacterized protein n=1 Tax=Rhizoctonia solani TaxID=456999 RepID=A0A8H3C390_9AGAM|nr:unnamed protein product [Rhizoctonia solani]